MSCFQSEKGEGVAYCFHLVVYDLIQPRGRLESQQDEISYIQPMVSILYFILISKLLITP